jgi:subfamily B ATP-binding cassette protein MsbA
VAFDDVHFVYPDGREALRGLRFEAMPGTTVALVGPSGGGKSTALSLIPRLLDAASGAVRIDGADVRTVTLASLRDSIAYVGQDALLFDDTVAANIAIGRPEAAAVDIQAAARAAAADSFITALPMGYDTRVGPGGQRLSGGQRQRVALVQTALAALRKGRTTIVIAHRLSTVRDADLVVALADGRAAESGTHAALMVADGLYARLVRSQTLLS